MPFATTSETANEHIAMLYGRAQELVVTRAVGVSDILENALVCLQAAEARLSKHTEPELIADVVALLGDVYAMRYEGDKEANLRASIHALELASKLYELTSAVDERIRALSSLGSSFRQLADVLPPESEQVDSQSHAVDSELGQRNARAGATKSFELAVTLLNDLRAPSPAYAIAVHNNLGNAFQAQFDGVDLSPLRRAVEEYKTSIDLVSRLRGPSRTSSQRGPSTRWRRILDQTWAASFIELLKIRNGPGRLSRRQSTRIVRLLQTLAPVGGHTKGRARLTQVIRGRGAHWRRLAGARRCHCRSSGPGGRRGANRASTVRVTLVE